MTPALYPCSPSYIPRAKALASGPCMELEQTRAPGLPAVSLSSQLHSHCLPSKAHCPFKSHCPTPSSLSLFLLYRQHYAAPNRAPQNSSGPGCGGCGRREDVGKVRGRSPCGPAPMHNVKCTRSDYCRTLQISTFCVW